MAVSAIKHMFLGVLAVALGQDFAAEAAMWATEAWASHVCPAVQIGTITFAGLNLFHLMKSRWGDLGQETPRLVPVAASNRELPSDRGAWRSWLQSERGRQDA